MPSESGSWGLAPLRHSTAEGTADGRGDLVSMRQVIAYNLGRARRERQMTQDQLGAVLVELTGKEWSRATISAAESGWDSQAAQRRVRHFEVNDVTAFSLALRVPMIWFFLPPPATPSGISMNRHDPWITIHKTGEQAEAAMSSESLLQMLFTQEDTSDPDDLMGRRMHREKLSPAQRPNAAADALGDQLNEIQEMLAQLIRGD